MADFSETTKTMRIFLTALFMSLFATPALAQLSPDGGPIQIAADRLDVFERENRAIYVGNVDVIQASARLRSDKLTINFKSNTDDTGSTLGGAFSSPDTMEAEGEVFYVTPDLKARGDKAVYTADTDTVVMTGNIILSRGEDIATGDCLTLQIALGRSTLGCDSRVRTQFAPSTVDAEPADSATLEAEEG